MPCAALNGMVTPGNARTRIVVVVEDDKPIGELLAGVILQKPFDLNQLIADVKELAPTIAA